MDEIEKELKPPKEDSRDVSEVLREALIDITILSAEKGYRIANSATQYRLPYLILDGDGGPPDRQSGSEARAAITGGAMPCIAGQTNDSCTRWNDSHLNLFRSTRLGRSGFDRNRIRCRRKDTKITDI